jgi:hypothetical protein
VSAVQSNSLTLLRWCKKHRLLVDGYERDQPNMYIQSMLSNNTAVQPWLDKHGYRLRADDPSYADMMERHCNDPDSSSSSSDSEASCSSASSSGGADSSSSSSGSNSSSNSFDSDERADHNPSTHDDDYFCFE